MSSKHHSMERAVPLWSKLALTILCGFRIFKLKVRRVIELAGANELWLS